MIKSSYFAIGAVMLASAAVLPIAAFAQAQATMPPLYNSAGMQVNAGNTSPIQAGTYYLQPGAQSPVQYYGNGTYYNPASGLYGGSSVYDPNGTAGVSLGYVTPTVGSMAPTIPAAPNTGLGGDSATVWMTLVLSGIVALAGVVYLGASSAKRYRYGATA